MKVAEEILACCKTGPNSNCYIGINYHMVDLSNEVVWDEFWWIRYPKETKCINDILWKRGIFQ